MTAARVLIVEDEPRIALALCRALEHTFGREYEIDISPVAETALKKLESKPIDLLVTDMRMPGMGGLAFIREVRLTYPDTHTMLITAHGSPDIEDLAKRLDVVYLPKPFSLQEFIATVEDILGPED
jgi:DNA-binding NtrC family response regulator